MKEEEFYKLQGVYPELNFLNKVNYLEFSWNGVDLDKLIDILKNSSDKEFFLTIIDDNGGPGEYELLPIIEDSNKENPKKYGDAQTIIFFRVKSKEFTKRLLIKVDEYLNSNSQYDTPNKEEYDDFTIFLEDEHDVEYGHGFATSLMRCLGFDNKDYEEIFDSDLEIENITDLSDNPFVVNPLFEGDCSQYSYIGYTN